MPLNNGYNYFGEQVADNLVPPRRQQRNVFYEQGFDGRPLQQQAAHPMDAALRALEERLDEVKKDKPAIPTWFKMLKVGDYVRLLVDTKGLTKDKTYKVALKDYSGCYVIGDKGTSDYLKFWYIDKASKLKLPTWF